MGTCEPCLSLSFFLYVIVRRKHELASFDQIGDEAARLFVDSGEFDPEGCVRGGIDITRHRQVRGLMRCDTDSPTRAKTDWRVPVLSSGLSSEVVGATGHPVGVRCDETISVYATAIRCRRPDSRADDPAVDTPLNISHTSYSIQNSNTF